MNKNGNVYIQKIFLYTANPKTFTDHILPLYIQVKEAICYVDTITAVFGFQRLVCLSVYRVSESVIKNLGSYRSSGIKSSSQLNNHTKHLKTEHLNRIFPMTFVEYCSIQLKHQTKAWLKWWSFQCVVSSVCMQLITHHWNMFSRSLRPIRRNVCPCVHVSVSICKSLPNSWVKINFDKIIFIFFIWSDMILSVYHLLISWSIHLRPPLSLLS